MIPVDGISTRNLYSQDDAPFLPGEGFTAKAAREAICESCRSGQLRSQSWRKRYWFTGKAFLEWLENWFGPELLVDDDANKPVAEPLAMPHNARTGLGPVRRLSGEEGSE